MYKFKLYTVTKIIILSCKCVYKKKINKINDLKNVIYPLQLGWKKLN